MEKENKKAAMPDINEELMMNLMVDGVKKEGLQLPSEATTLVSQNPIAKDINRSKKLKDLNYESLFFKKTDGNARDGKTVYIRPEYHEKMSRIVQVIGEDKISIYAYLDNLLNHHFKEFGEQITQSYNDKYKPI